MELRACGCRSALLQLIADRLRARLNAQVYRGGNRGAVPPAVVERALPGLALRAEQHGSTIQAGQTDGKRKQVRICCAGAHLRTLMVQHAHLRTFTCSHAYNI